MSTLDQALAPYEKVAHELAFLNVDVEGFERQVFASIDLEQHRPSVILAEATEPLTERASYCVQTDKIAKGIRLNGYLPYGR